MKTLRLGLQLLAKDIRAGELSFLLLALILAVTAICSVNFYTDRIARALHEQAAGLLGADLIVTSATPVAQQWRNLAENMRLLATETVQYPTVAASGQQLQLVNLKVVKEAYPLRGTIRINPNVQHKIKIPDSGTLWVDARLLDLLNLKIKDSIYIGVEPFTITHTIVEQPQSGLFNMAPAVLMNSADVAKTKTLVPGSRAEYRFLVAGDQTAVAAFKKQIRRELTPGQRIIDVDSNQLSLNLTLNRANNYLTLATLICTLLAGIAIGNSAWRYTRRHYNNVALLRCLGVTRKQLIALILLQFILAGILGSAVGCLLGYAAQTALAAVFSPWLAITLPAPTIYPVFTGFLTGFLLLIGFAAPRLLALTAVAPIQVFRKEQLRVSNSMLSVYGLALAAIAGLLLWHTNNALLTVLLLYGIGFTAAGLYLCARLLITTVNGIKDQAPLTWRYGLANLARRSHTSVLQLIAFGLIIFVTLLLIIIRHDLIKSWQAQIPANAPNYFVINIQPDELKAVDAFLNQRQIRRSQDYPIVRGRLTALNNIPIKQAVPVNAANNNALNRELNLTWSDALPPTNTVVAGRWWPADEKQALVSVESKLASELNIKLKDKLTFQIADQTITANVASLRSLEWSSFQPNFYMIFPPGLLNSFPFTYLTSFYLPPDHKAALADLVKQFPSVTIIDVAELLQQVATLIQRVSLAITYLIIISLLASLAVLFTAIQATMPERLFEAALLRTLGASKKQLIANTVTEFALLGLLAGILGAAGALFCSYILAEKIFALSYAVDYSLIVCAILTSMVLIALAGLLGTKNIIKQPPLKLLRV